MSAENNASTTVDIDTNEIEEKEKVKSYSGFLIQCGHCQSNILYPYGCARIQCPVCKELNYANTSTAGIKTPQAVIKCPQCKNTIKYTLGCTHFHCSCGTVITLEVIFFRSFHS
ncbi:hypothetical protein WA171_006399 [Blastocystis sp. BT1]